MSTLQTEVPILFDLLGCVTHFPVQSMSQVIEELIKKSKAPFDDVDPINVSDFNHIALSEDVLCELSYFPCLPNIVYSHSQFDV